MQGWSVAFWGKAGECDAEVKTLTVLRDGKRQNLRVKLTSLSQKPQQQARKL